MNLQAALHDLSDTMTGADRVAASSRLRLARRILIDCGLEALKIEFLQSNTETVIRAAAIAPQTPARRTFAVLIVHALAVRGLYQLVRPVMSAPLSKARYCTYCCGLDIHSRNDIQRQCWIGFTKIDSFWKLCNQHFPIGKAYAPVSRFWDRFGIILSTRISECDGRDDGDARRHGVGVILNQSTGRHFGDRSRPILDSVARHRTNIPGRACSGEGFDM